VRLLSRHEPAVRAFIRTAVSDWDAVDEIMQEAGLVAWRKFDTLDSPDGFLPWLRIIAKFEVLKHRRAAARNRLVLDDDIVQALLDEEAADDNDRHRERQIALEKCLEKLPPARRELVLRAYAPDRPITALAAQLQKSPDAVYKMLSRLRRELADCVTRSLAGGDVA
jgi:RNA polymerase sigma-70 factor (ECF subfamily)